MRTYQDLITETTRCFPTQARHAEAWMRLERGTLDGLNRAAFSREARVALQCVMASSEAENESLAQSYGLFAAGGAR